MAVFIRLPIVSSRIHVGFDDGVYLASVGLMRAGHTPFVDFFSSQGPLFLPLLRWSDLLGLGDPRGPRLMMLTAGALLTILIYLLCSQLTNRTSAFGLSLLGATSGTFLAAAGPVQSDGLALALGLGGLLVLIRARSTSWLLAAGALFGLALSIKSLHLAPLIMSVTVLLLVTRRWSHLPTIAGAALVTTLVVWLPFGVGAVWRQYVRFHLDRGPLTDSTSDLKPLLDILVENETPLLFVALLGIGSLILTHNRTRSKTPALPWWFSALWLTLTGGILLMMTDINSGFVRFVAFLVPPIILLVARSRIPPLILVAVGVLSIGYQIVFAPLAQRVVPTESQMIAMEDLGSLPPGAFVVTDDPGLVWFSGRLPHPGVADPSFARIKVEGLTAVEVEDALRDPATCGYLEWSDRFEGLSFSLPPDYVDILPSGLVARSSCELFTQSSLSDTASSVASASPTPSSSTAVSIMPTAS